MTEQTPVLGTGRALRIYTLARALTASGTGLLLSYVRFGADEPDAAFSAIEGVELREVLASRGVRRAALYARRRVARVPAAWARGISPELVAAARELAGAPDVRRVIADGPIVAAALAPLARHRPIIYNAHNLESSFRNDLGERGFGSRRALRAAERRLLARSAESWMVSEAEVAGARALCPGARIRYVPNVVDTAAIRPRTSRTPLRRALMVADFSYAPNRNALRFLLDDVLPLVWSTDPDIVVALAGRGLGDPAPGEPRVEVLGFVCDLANEYARAGCALVPLLDGGGTPLKFIEALAYGVPVVATGRAAAGLAVTHDEHYVRADDGPAFAAAITRLLASDDGTAAALMRSGRALVEQRYSIDALSALVSP